jgi:hypothetical protein
MLDLLIIFIPYLPKAQREALFKATATDVMLEHNDATVQKKSYRILKRCLEIHSTGVDLAGLVQTLGEVGAGVGAGAQRVSCVLAQIQCRNPALIWDVGSITTPHDYSRCFTF